MKSDSIPGSNDLIRVYIWDKVEDGHQSAFWLKFTQPNWQYKLGYCFLQSKEWNSLPAEPPESAVKIWKIVKNSTFLTLTCNNVEVLVFEFAKSSPSTDCRSRWEGDKVAYISFAGLKSTAKQDTASDFYSAVNPWVALGKNS